MKTQTHMHHRHFIVAPVAAMLIGITFVLGKSIDTNAIEGSITEYYVQNTIVQELPSGVRAFLYDGATVDISAEFPAVTNGSVLFDTQGMLHVQAGHAEVIALHGAVHVSHNNDKVSVATISSPAVIRLGGHYAMLPIGMQWTVPLSLPGESVGYRLWHSARVGTPISRRFHKDTLKKLSSFDVHTDSGLPPTAFFKPSEIERLRFEILFPEKRLQAEQQWDEQYLGHFRSVVSKKNRQKVRQMLQEDFMSHIVLSERGQQVLALLSADQQGGSEYFVDLFQELVQANPDLWLVASMHPRFADTAWFLGSPLLAQEPQLLALLALPSMDKEKKPLSDIAIAHWKDGVEDFLQSSQNPDVILPFLTSYLTEKIDELESLQYPVRAQKIARASRNILQPYSAMFDTHTSELYQKIANREQVDVYEYIRQEKIIEEVTKKDKQKVEEKLPPTVPALPSEKVEELAEEILLEGGALFTVETTIRAIAEPNTAHVRAIIFSATTADRTFDFKLNVTTGQVSGITENGKTFAYPMWVEDFVKWAKQ